MYSDVFGVYVVMIAFKGFILLSPRDGPDREVDLNMIIERRKCGIRIPQQAHRSLLHMVHPQNGCALCRQGKLALRRRHRRHSQWADGRLTGVLTRPAREGSFRGLVVCPSSGREQPHGEQLCAKEVLSVNGW